MRFVVPSQHQIRAEAWLIPLHRLSAAQSVIERTSKTLGMRGAANRKNVQPVLRFCHQQGLIGGMMALRGVIR
jgi:hypothetical protein